MLRSIVGGRTLGLLGLGIMLDRLVNPGVNLSRLGLAVGIAGRPEEGGPIGISGTCDSDEVSLGERT